jgi:hypothetical protein
MSVTTDSAAVRTDGPVYIHWGAIIAGAIAATALSFILVSFAISLGLGVMSSEPTWRDASVALWVLTGLYLMLQALAGFALGGYVAGRLRERWGHSTTADEIEFRDGVHGALTWAVAVVLGALTAAATSGAIASRLAPTASAWNTAPGAESLVAYDLDRLFRGDRRPEGADLSYPRAEAGRILLKSSGHTGITPDDRTHLVRIVAARTGLAAPEAERRVDDVVARSHEGIRKARRSGVIVGFMTAAALLLGAAASWFAACIGGRHRDGNTAPSLTAWPITGPPTRRATM